MPYFKTENSNAENIKYDNTKSVKEAIDDIKNNQAASSVTFNNTNTGLASVNVQDAVTEVNGNLSEFTNDIYLTARTDKDGDIDLPVHGSSKKIIYAYNNANLYVVPRYIFARNCWGVKILNKSWIPIANTNVTIYYAVGESKS